MQDSFFRKNSFFHFPRNTIWASVDNTGSSWLTRSVAWIRLWRACRFDTSLQPVTSWFWLFLAARLILVDSGLTRTIRLYRAWIWHCMTYPDARLRAQFDSWAPTVVALLHLHSLILFVLFQTRKWICLLGQSSLRLYLYLLCAYIGD